MKELETFATIYDDNTNHWPRSSDRVGSANKTQIFVCHLVNEDEIAILKQKVMRRIGEL